MMKQVSTKKRLLSLFIVLVMALGIAPANLFAADPLADPSNSNWLIYSTGRQAYVQHMTEAGYGGVGIVASEEDPAAPAAQWTLLNYNGNIPAEGGFFRFVTAAATDARPAGSSLKYYDGSVYVEGGGENGNATSVLFKPGATPGTVVLYGGNGNPAYPPAANASNGVVLNADGALRSNAANGLEEFIVIPPSGYVPAASAISGVSTPDGSNVIVKWPVPTAFASNYILERSTNAEFTADVKVIDIKNAAYEEGYVMSVVDGDEKAAGVTYFYRLKAEDYWHTGANAVIGESGSITMPSSLPPTVATTALSFFKQPLPSDQVISFDPGFGDPYGATGVAGISVGETALVADTDYTVDWAGKTITIKASALANLAVGSYVISVKFARPAGEAAFDVALGVFEALSHADNWLIFSPEAGGLVGLNENGPYTVNSNTLNARYTSPDSVNTQWALFDNAVENAAYPYYFQTLRAPGTNKISLYNGSFGAWETGVTGASAVAFVPQENGTVKIHSSWTWADVTASGNSADSNEVSAAQFIIIPPDSYIPGDAANTVVVSEELTNVSFTWSASAAAGLNYFAGFRIFRQERGNWVEMTDDDNLVVKNDNGVYSFTDTQPVDNNSNYKIVTDTANKDSEGVIVEAYIDATYPPEILTPMTTFNKQLPEDLVFDLSWGFGDLKATDFSSVMLDGQAIAYTIDGFSVVIDADVLSALNLANGNNHSIRFAFNDTAATAVEIPMNVLNASSALAAPQNVAVNGDGTGAILSWDAVPNATGYQIFRGLGKYAPDSFTTLVAAVNGATSYDLGTAYVWDWYKVVAFSGDGAYLDSPMSEMASLEFTTFPKTEIFTENDDPATVSERTDYYSRLFFWGGGIGNGSPEGARPDNQFTDDRIALLFRPARGHAADFSYLSMYLNFYMHIAGLGKLPTDVQAQRVEVGSWEGGNYNGEGNVTQNFWRTFENLEALAAGQSRFGVSQASPVRRVKTGPMRLQLYYQNPASASGGFIADSMTGWLTFGGQQQFYLRNMAMEGTDGLIWNGVMQGNTNLDGTAWEQSYTPVVVDVEHTPVIAEKPFIYFDVEANDGTGDYKVFVPGIRKDATGLSWGAGKENGGMGVGESRNLSDFFVAQATMTADEIIAGMQTKNGNIFFTPGVYKLDKEILVTEPNAVLLGIGEASLRPTNANVCIRVANVPGVRVAGLLFDAGPAPDNDFEKASEALLIVGEDDCEATPEMKESPIMLYDVIARVGGVDTPEPCKAKSAVIINADYTVLDHAWIWRADHGQQVGWALNQTDYGLVVNGDDVVTYGLHSEHYQKYDVLWNGDNGRCYFLQNERPYDTPTTNDVEGAWRDTSLAGEKYDYIDAGIEGADRQQGYAAFRVGDDVKNFEGWGLVSYDVFVQNLDAGFRRIWSAFVTPENGNIKIHQAGTLSISAGNGEIAHVINGQGAATPHTIQGTVFLPGNEFATTMPEELRDTFAVERAALCVDEECPLHTDCTCEGPALCMTIFNATEEEQTARIIVSGYDSEDRLVDSNESLLTIEPSVYYNGGIGGDTAIVDNASELSYADYNVALELPEADNIASYKAFIWNGTTYVPMTESFVIPE